ncbi:glycosyltransferase family 2 protein [Desulforhopalus singaporensis]|nr:glycosyltransferase family 2 protein [Desulforhopalus singaporensis]
MADETPNSKIIMKKIKKYKKDNSIKFSIITVTLNAERYIECNICSIINQSYENYEFIIIDGQSNDSTLEKINKYKEKIDIVVSEPDKGIGDAMNKGVKLATGDYILFIQSDDFLTNSSVLSNIAEQLHNMSDFYIFQVKIFEKNNTTFRSKNINWQLNFKMNSCHQGQVISRHLFNSIGNFDTNFKICMDYDFILRSYRSRASFAVKNFTISTIRLTGISSKTDWNSQKRRFNEEKNVHKKNCPNIIMNYIYMLYWSLYLPYRKMRYLSQTRR